MTVHPRWRGEHASPTKYPGTTCGSSPLARGTPDLFDIHYVQSGFIPAGAGNTLVVIVYIRCNPVHPRWRGEHSDSVRSVSPDIGSSPLARGTRKYRFRHRFLFRFNPAGAGNTYPRCGIAHPEPVHPRWRGEHNCVLPCAVCARGSSPLARGTHFLHLHEFSRKNQRPKFYQPNDIPMSYSNC